MELKTIFENSLILQNWYYLIITFLVIILLNYYNKINKKITATTKKTTAVEREQQLADAEDVGDEDNNASLTGDTGDAYIPALEDKAHVLYKGATVNLPGGAKQFYEMVNNRRSVRSFRSSPVPDVSLVEECIRAAGTAPSGAHTEPWTFCLIADAAVKREIRKIVEAEEELNYAQRMHRQWKTDLRPLRTNHVKEYLTEAPYLVLVFKQIYGESADSGRRRQHYYHEISVAIATGVLLCALQAAGLSSLVTTPLNCGPALRTLLGRGGLSRA